MEIEGTRNAVAPIPLSIVIPAYNEAARLGPTLQRIRQYITSHAAGAQVIVVDDGSSDRTAEIARSFEREPMVLRVIRNDVNRGKGHAVRCGVLQAAGDPILICDADMNTPIEDLQKLLPVLHDGCDIVIGSRAMPDSIIDPPRPVRRRMASFLFRILRRLLVLPALRDTQCGFKLLTRAAAQRLFALQTIDGYAFDCEVLALADALGYHIREVGVRWSEGSEIHIQIARSAPRMLRDLLSIRRRVQRLTAAAR